MELKRREWGQGEKECWLADKIVAYDDYTKEAAFYLRKQAEEIAKLREELAAAKAETAKAKHVAHALSTDLIVAEAKPKAAREQEPEETLVECIAGSISKHIRQPLLQREVIEAAQYIARKYAAQIPPADVQNYTEKDSLIQQQDIALEQKDKRIAELERKLAEQQANITQVRMLLAGEAHPRWDNSFQTTTTRGRILDLTEGGSEELNTLLAKAREEGRILGLAQTCPACHSRGYEEGRKEALQEVMKLADSANTAGYVWVKVSEMLAAVPKPEVKS